MKDSDVIKKSTKSLGHSPEKLKYVALEIVQMEMFPFGESGKKYFK